MIQSFVDNTINLSSNSDSIRFQTDCIRTNSCNGYRGWLCHEQGSANYTITQGGLYEIDFNASVSSATARSCSVCFI